MEILNEVQKVPKMSTKLHLPRQGNVLGVPRRNHGHSKHFRPNGRQSCVPLLWQKRHGFGRSDVQSLLCQAQAKDAVKQRRHLEQTKFFCPWASGATFCGQKPFFVVC